MTTIAKFRFLRTTAGVLATLLLSTMVTLAAAARADVISVAVGPVNDSGVAGTAVLTAAGDQTIVELNLTGLTGDHPRRENVLLALAAVAGATAADIYCAQALGSEDGAEARIYDYSDRSGMPRPPQQMRGVASAAESDAYSDQPGAPVPSLGAQIG